ncbi:MAG: S41 family peptidase [Ferruginibacter sp.]
MRLLLIPVLLLSVLIGFSQKNSRQIDNVKAFAKLYGYTRYFHPSDEAAALNWNKFAIYGANEVRSAKNEEELLETLRKLFAPIAPAIKLFNKKSPQKFDPAGITPPARDGYEIIAWQHLGTGISSNSIYKSVRINRPEQKMAEAGNAFAPFTQVIDAAAYRGKEIRLSGYVKMSNREDESGTGHLWLRVDKKTGTGFFYNMIDNPITSPEWKEYSFTGTVDTNAASIALGGYLLGKGTMLADKIKLEVKEGAVWSAVELDNPSFETNNDNKIPGWLTGAVAKQSKNSGSGYNYSVNNKDAYEGKASIEVTSAKREEKAVMAKKLFDTYPSPGEVLEKTISESLAVLVPIALYGTAAATYPPADIEAGKELFKKLEGVQTRAKGDELAVRLGDVVIAWNIFRHFFPYWDDASKNAEQVLTEALQKSFEDKTAVDFRQTLELMTAPLNDGHIWVSLAGDTSDNFQPNIQVVIAENKVVVDKLAEGGDMKDLIKPGDIIEKIDGKNAMQLVAEKQAYISGSPQWKNYRVITKLLAGSKGSRVQLTINRNGKMMEHLVQCIYPVSELYSLINAGRRPSGIIKEGVYYLDINVLHADTIKKWANSLSEAKAIICDLRGYPTGNHNLINHLLTVKEDTKWMFVPQITRADYENVSYQANGWNMKPDRPHFSGKIIFITDGRAISYAESFMGFIKDFKLATIVGGATAGTNGNVNPFSVPGGYTVSWTGMLVKNHDGSKHHIRGILPDVPVERSISGIREGKDELLEKAMEIIQ